jgi:hypothetical protein
MAKRRRKASTRKKKIVLLAVNLKTGNVRKIPKKSVKRLCK